MNSSAPTVDENRTATPVDARPTCPACPHELAAHDSIGLRFCAVTTSRSLDRGCACHVA